MENGDTWFTLQTTWNGRTRIRNRAQQWCHDETNIAREKERGVCRCETMDRTFQTRKQQDSTIPRYSLLHIEIKEVGVSEAIEESKFSDWCLFINEWCRTVVWNEDGHKRGCKENSKLLSPAMTLIVIGGGGSKVKWRMNWLWYGVNLPLTSSSSTVVFESEDSLTWDSSPFLAIIDLPASGSIGAVLAAGV